MSEHLVLAPLLESYFRRRLTNPRDLGQLSRRLADADPLRRGPFAQETGGVGTR
jgi:hypothetical protein